jgi:ABC-type dipeptide/oligopeptide/nickel transport system permease component
MAAFLLRRVFLGLVALFLALTGSYVFWIEKNHACSAAYAGCPPKVGIFNGYWTWLSGVFTGHSLSTGQLPDPASEVVNPPPAHLLSYVAAPFGRTLLLLAVTLVIVVAIAIPLGVIGAAMRGSIVDVTLRILAYAAWAVPAFLLATILQEGLGRISGGWGTGWFPEAGWAGECPNGHGIDPHNFQCPSGGHGFGHVGLVLYHLVLPAAALALGFIGLNSRYLRNSLLEALDQPYIAVARGKGLTERRVLLHHGVRNALGTFIPALVSDFGLILGGAIAVDYIFQLGGLGSMFIGGLKLDASGFVTVDTNAYQFALLLAGGLMITASILGEVSLWLLDPRVRQD